MDTMLKIVVCGFIMVLLSKIVKVMKNKNFFIIEELANLAIDIFKTVFALLKAIIKLCDDLMK